MSKAKMMTYWGVPCLDFQKGCLACEAWKVFRATKRVPKLKEVYESIGKEVLEGTRHLRHHRLPETQMTLAEGRQL